MTRDEYQKSVDEYQESVLLAECDFRWIMEHHVVENREKHKPAKLLTLLRDAWAIRKAKLETLRATRRSDSGLA
jgi:hypothetical protein